MELDTARFPHNGYEVKLVRKKDILQTIEDNIIDKELAEELVANLEAKAEKYLAVDADAWIGIPFLGSIRAPKTVKLFNDEEFKAAKKYVLENRSKEEYVMFMANATSEAHQNNQYEAYFKIMIAKYARLYPITYRKWYKEKGEHYAKCRIVFSNCHKPVKQTWEYLYENQEDEED